VTVWVQYVVFPNVEVSIGHVNVQVRAACCAAALSRTLTIGGACVAGTGRRNNHVKKAAVQIEHQPLAQPKQTLLVFEAPPAGCKFAEPIGQCIAALIASVILFGAEGVKSRGIHDPKVHVAAEVVARELSLHVVETGNSRA
jgi:hypothetical protein